MKRLAHTKLSPKLSIFSLFSVFCPLSVDTLEPVQTLRVGGDEYMRIKEEILEEFRRGTSFAEIRRKYRSMSQLYEAIREYFVEAEKTSETIQKKLEKHKTDLLETKTGLKEAKRERKEVSKELHELIQARDELVEEVSRRNQELNSLLADITELSEKGYTSEILKKIKAIENRSGFELLEKVETVAKYKQIEKQVSHLTKKKSGLERTVRVLEKREEKMKAKLVSERNRLDELKLGTVTFEEAIDTVLSLFEDGYSAKDIESLRQGLHLLEIKDKRIRSVTRLVEGLKKQKTLVALEKKLIKKKKELEFLEHQLSDTKAKLKVARQTTLRAIEETQKAASKAIYATGEETQKTTRNALRKFEAFLDRVEADLQRITEQVKDGLGEWSNLQQKMGRLRDSIFLGEVMLGIMKSTQYLKEIPPSIIADLLDRLLLWSELNYPELTIKPSQTINRKEFNLNPFLSYKLSAWA